MLVHGIETPLGPLTALWSTSGLCRIQFGAPAVLFPGSTQHLPSSKAAGAAGPIALELAVAEYFAGGELDFPSGHIDWTGIPDFHRRVLQRCAKIGRGETLTYGQLAAAVGSPLAARAVGQAMARNRLPLVIPCHRVLGSAGRLTGYSGVGGIATKSQLLSFERQSKPWQCLQLQLA